MPKQKTKKNKLVRELIEAGPGRKKTKKTKKATKGKPLKHFTISTDTVLDNRTGLQWQREVPPKVYTWERAKKYATALVLGGYDDWRLPTIQELQSIVDFGRYNPAIDTGAFPDMPTEFFWSSSPYAGYAGSAWGVYFYDGYTNATNTTFYGRVRCVR